MNSPVKTIRIPDSPCGFSQNGKATEPKKICPTLADISEIAFVCSFDSIFSTFPVF